MILNRRLNMLIKRVVGRLIRIGKHFFYGKPVMKQELLLRLALKEAGFNFKKLKIICDHNLGLNYVNGIELGIKYPLSFYEESLKLIPQEKEYLFYFNGNMSANGKRDLLLKKFQSLPDSAIVSSDEGRNQNNKDKFNYSYFNEMAKSQFGLCPHQLDWTGDKDKLWTYRFIESCFVKAIPVLFIQTPLGKDFIKDFNFIWDDTIRLDDPSTYVYNDAEAEENLILSKERFCLTLIECEKIKATLKN